ncbi:hypothetical protein ANN_20215 [Periplaneta americana]|uniref:Uncharacterized protein n=1 Tax=Periplaneta americana TaxID=6978 RepID=A0ABQ8SD61_PERAM|nr:hypothetical protein ANN_20215 [Periplaneta americana]
MIKNRRAEAFLEIHLDFIVLFNAQRPRFPAAIFSFISVITSLLSFTMEPRYLKQETLEYDDRDWINLAQDRDRLRAYVIAAMNLRVP